MARLTTKSSLYSWVLQGLFYSLLMSVFMGGIIIVFMAGLYFEFSGTLFFNGDRTSQSLLSISNIQDIVQLTDALVVMSSRDTQTIRTIFSLWQLSLFATSLTAIFCLLKRINVTVMIDILFSVAVMLIINLDALPQGIDAGYLITMSVVVIGSVVAFWYVKRFIAHRALSPNNQALIAYASQSGTARNIALSMAKSSQMHCDIRAFSQLTPECLLGYNQLFVVASTYGDGQAPEKSMRFSQALGRWQQQLTHLNYAVLALGDKAYPHFCAFGHHVANMLSDKGAVAMYPVQEIDRADDSVISIWWQQIGVLLGWKTQGIENQWLTSTLIDNQCVNSAQPQRPAHILSLAINSASYQAGDLLEILTPTPLVAIDEKLLQFGLAPQTIVRMGASQCQLNHALTKLEWTDQMANSAQALVDKLSSLRPRVYSIASTPNDNVVRILVRHLKKDDGSDGFSSSQLCNAQPSQQFEVAIRDHENFRLPNSNVPIVMVGAGTGIAPFMSFLAQRKQQGVGDSWLIFGEQYSNHDNYFNIELDSYLEDETLTRLDCAFSRDKAWLLYGKPRYVDHIISGQSRQLYHWLYDKGAHLYVCGNKAGMGESVKTALRLLLKDDFEQLMSANRLHFDLY